MKNRTILYGYCCNNGIIAAHPQESVIVDSICREYLDGKSLLTIATRLNDEQIEYMPGITGWNKARLKRILEDERYLGKEPYEKAMEYLNAASEKGNPYAEQLLHSVKSNRSWGEVRGAFRLLHHLVRILQNGLNDDKNGKGGKGGIDRKLRRRINEKKQAQGLKLE